MKKNKKLVTGLLTLTLATGAYIVSGCDNSNNEQFETIYNVKYVLNGGNNNDENPTSYKSSNNTVALKEASKYGYTFAGWYKESSFVNQVTSIEKGDKGHLTLYAKFVPIEYTITYDLAGGELVVANPDKYTIMSENINLNQPVKTGYKFLGWKDEDQPQAAVVQHKTILKGSSGNKRYTAQWELAVYNITTVSAHGAVDVQKGANLGDEIEFDVIVYDGYEVKKIEINGEEFVEEEKKFLMPDRDVEIKVTYEPIKYTITYDLDGGVNHQTNVEEYTIESETFMIREADKAGYQFKAWLDLSTGEEHPYIEIQKGSMGNKSYKAIWEIQQHEIDYISEHGSVTGLPNTAAYGDTVEFAVNVNPGYELMSIRINGEEIDINETSFVMPDGNVVIEFSYRKGLFDITYVLGDAENDSRNPQYYDEDTGLELYDPIKDGYAFIGWYTDDTFQNQFTYNGEGENLTLYARFAKASLNGVYYNSLAEAINDAAEGDRVMIEGNIKIEDSITIDKSITIESANKAVISVGEEYKDSEMFIIDADTKTVTFSNIVVDGNEQCLVVKASSGHLDLLNSEITGGYSETKAAGVHVNGNATLTISGGKIKGNINRDDDDYYEHASDLYIESDLDTTVVKIFNGAEIENMFVEANTVINQSHKTVVLDGGKIRDMYLAYGDGKSASLGYLDGEITDLMVATTTLGEYNKIKEITESSYFGGSNILTQNGWSLSLENAISTSISGSTIKVFGDYQISDSLLIRKDITIIGDGGTITPSDAYLGSAMILIESGATNVNLNNINLDARAKSRVIKSSSGKLTLTNCNITGGYTESYIAGVYITEEATFEMKSGSIIGNNIKTRVDYLKYATDLWIGSEASGVVAAISDDATVGNVFVNANSYKLDDGGVFKLDGGNIENVYVEYDDNMSGEFNFVSGTVGNIYISTQTTGSYIGVENPAFGIYTGGNTITNGTSWFSDLNQAILATKAGETITINNNEIISSPLTISANITIDGNGFEISATDTFEGDSMIIINSNAGDVLLKNMKLNARSMAKVIEASSGHLILEECTVVNGYSSEYAAGVHIKGDATLELLGGEIKDNSSTTQSSYLIYGSDLCIESEAEGEIVLIDNGTIIGNMLINPVENQPNDSGIVVLEDGSIENAYVGYANEKAATLNYVSGEITNILIASKESDEYETITGTDVLAGIYVGGEGYIEE